MTKMTRLPQIEDNQEYAQLLKRVGELGVEKSQIERRLAQLHRSLEDMTSGGAVKARREAEALALLENKPLEQTLPGKLVEERDRLVERRRLIERTLKVADDRLKDVATAASRELCKAVAPQHRELKRKELQAAVELARAVRAEKDFIDTVFQRGAVHRMPPVTEPCCLLEGHLDLQETGSLLNMRLRDAVDDGTFSRSEVERMSPETYKGYR